MNIINAVAMHVTAMLKFGGYPTKSEYTSLVVEGGHIYDYIQIKNTELTTAEMLSYQKYVDPLWDGNTLALATFRNNFSAGNVDNIVNPLTNWIVQRKKSTESVYTTLAVVGADAVSFMDLTVESGYTYEYQIIAINETELSDPLFNTLNSSFFNHLLIDPTTGMAVVFDANLEFDGYTEEVAYETYDGYNRYPAHSIGKRRYKIGSAKALVHENMCVDNELVQTIDYLKTLDDFINNGNNKIMKDRKGNVLLVKTLDGMTQNPLNVGLSQQPYEISFNFVEVGEVDG